jgi:NAD(P)-dependent dehydrogenase (short-subunit alcohol dehydrogenase family)
MTGRLVGKSALITGSARGIGKHFAKRYLAEGATVAIADLNLEAAEKTAAELGAGAYAVHMDVTVSTSINQAVQSVVDRAGKLDILINNAALFTASPTVEINTEQFHKLYAVNVYGTLFSIKAAAKQMIAQGHGGKIINMASQAGRRGEPFVAVYCSTKAAVISITQSTGLDLIKHGINVNAISPGVVDGEHWDHVDSLFAKWEGKELGQKKKEVAAGVPFGRFGKPDDLVGMAVFLASDDAEYVVAQTYNVDGGQWMS